jgi:hypothetical protein
MRKFLLVASALLALSASAPAEQLAALPPQSKETIYPQERTWDQEDAWHRDKADPMHELIWGGGKNTLQEPKPVVEPDIEELPNCNNENVLRALTRAMTAQTILKARNAPSSDPDELRWCRAEVLTASGNFVEVAYFLQWTSKAELRFYLEVAGARRM